MANSRPQTTAERVAVAARDYLASQSAEAKAQNELARNPDLSMLRETLAEAAWNATCTCNQARIDLMAALSTWEAESNAG